MKHAIYEELKKGPLLFDGATGTYARQLPDYPSGSIESACLTAPDCVRRLHLSYLQVGSRAVKTNTFAAYPGLGAENEQEQTGIIHAAVRIAREAAAEHQAWVFSDIGPAPKDSEPLDAYRRMADLFIEEGIDCFLLETMKRSQGVREAAEYIRLRCPEAFIAVSFAASPDGFLESEEDIHSVLTALDRCEAIDALGLNCVCGAAHMRRMLERLSLRHLLIAMPNAGYPQMADGRLFYNTDPDYYARQTADYVSLGVRLLGGCCGTTPEHIRNLRRALQYAVPYPAGAEEKPSVGTAVCKSRLLEKLKQSSRPILVELDPPRSADSQKLLTGAKQLSESGVDVITLADCPIGRPHMDASLLACKLRRELGTEVLPHMTCRDRNINATKALLLGLAMEGIANVLLVTGDPIPSGDREAVKSVFQFNSKVLMRFVKTLGETGEASPFFICGALNINAVNFDAELRQARLKEEAGCMAFLTQPILSRRAVENLKKARCVLKGYLLAGLFPVVSYKNACFLSGEISGMEVDPELRDAYKGLDRAQGEALAERICLEAAQAVSADADGFYIMTPFQRVDLVRRIAAALRENKL